MIGLAKIAIIIILFGQLAYNAATYYLNISHPSYPVWGTLYLTVATLVISWNIPRGFSQVDMLFFVCVSWMALSFAIVGQADPRVISLQMIVFIAAPYIIGRFIGRYLRASDFLRAYALAAIMLALMLVEYVRDPDVFSNVDRLRVFNSDATESLQGGTAYYVASLFGGVFLISLAALTLSRPEKLKVAGLGSLTVHKIVAALSLIVLLLWGSRGGLLAVLSICGWLIVRSMRISLGKALGGLTAAVVLAAGLYFNLPPERQAFIDEIPAGLATFGQVSFCEEGGTSILAHLTLLRESYRLFIQSPLFGIGAANFGHQWCGQQADIVGPHNNILHALVELGLAGAAVWVALFIAVMNLYRRSYPAMSGESKLVTRYIFLLWMYTFLAAQTAGNLFEDYQLYTLTGLLVSYVFKPQLGRAVPVIATQATRPRNANQLAAPPNNL